MSICSEALPATPWRQLPLPLPEVSTLDQNALDFIQADRIVVRSYSLVVRGKLVMAIGRRLGSIRLEINSACVEVGFPTIDAQADIPICTGAGLVSRSEQNSDRVDSRHASLRCDTFHASAACSTSAALITFGTKLSQLVANIA